jgi:predicted RNA binding protein YcfA (HicA-like mRNA interferase family)
MNQSPKNFIRILEEQGWLLKRIKGSHNIMFNPISFKTIVIPIHGNKDIPKGLFLTLIKQAKLSKTDFE